MRTAVRSLLLSAALTLPLAACNDDGKSEADSNADQNDEGCTPGELNCECNDNQCLNGLECVEGMCVSACIPGELGCECNAGQCVGGLECVADVCMDSPGDGDGEPTGDGDGSPTGDGDGSPTGDGDGSPTGDGDGDGSPTGDGDGDGSPTGDGDGDGDGAPECPNANEMMCDGQCIDVLDNDDNCGSCGNVCGVANNMSIGGCTDGACDPFWSDCYQQSDGFTTCNQICANEGKSCAQSACGGGTMTYANAQSFCVAKNLGAPIVPTGCDQPLNWQTIYLMCCCQ